MIGRLATASFAFAVLASLPVHASLEFGPPYLLSGGFENPFGLAVDESNDHLIVTDTRNRQLRWAELAALTGTPTFEPFGLVADPNDPDALIDPQGVAADGNGNVYVVDARLNRVFRYQWDASVTNYVADPSFAASNVLADNLAMKGGRDIAVDPTGRVYVLDSGGGRVLRIEGPTDATWEVFVADDSLLNPYGLAVGNDGRVYVADTGNHRIARYSPSGAAAGKFGQYGRGSEQLRSPRDVAVGADHRMFIADSHNHRIEILTETGNHVYALGKAPAMGSIQSVVLDSQGRLYIADSDADRIVAYLGSSAPVPFDAWVRDHVGDGGAEPTDPFYTLGSPDLLIRRDSTLDPTTVGPPGLEAITFEQPRFGDDENYVYVAVRNRGTQELSGAVVKFYWADPASPLLFPDDWSDAGFFPGTSLTESNSLVVPTIPPGDVRTLGPMRWSPPSPENTVFADGEYVLSARVIHPFDVPMSAGGLQAIRDSNNLAIRTVYVDGGPSPVGAQNTLVIPVRYADDPTAIDDTMLSDKMAALAAWVEETSWATAAVDPYVFKLGVDLPHPRAHYEDPSNSRIIELVEDAVNNLFPNDDDVLEFLGDNNRVIIVTNDQTPDVHWATTGPWPYQIASTERLMTASVEAMTNDVPTFAQGYGHQLRMVDLFPYPNVVFPRPFASGWDNMDKPFTGVHPTVWSKERATWPSELGAPVVYIPRPASGHSFDTGQNPLPLFHQSTAEAGQPISIAIGTTPGVGVLTDETAFYYLEARSNALGNLDTALPGSGVLMYRVNEEIPQGQGPVLVVDQQDSTTTLDDAVIPGGGTASPPGTGLTVTVNDGPIDGPDYLIDLSYTPPIAHYDVYMEKGDPVWTSPDIWVDNQSDGYDEDQNITPTDNGDTAIGGEENRVYARVHNTGPADAYDVEVAFFFSDPYHTIGGAGAFDYLESTIIPHIPAESAVTTYIEWHPANTDETHTCVRVELRRLFDDINEANDSAQQNLRVDWSSSGSPYLPVNFPFQVVNEEDFDQLIYFRADGIPEGWSHDFNKNKALLTPGQKHLGSLNVVPAPDAKNCTRHDIRVTAWTPREDTIIRLGGATLQLNLAREAALELDTRLRQCDPRERSKEYAERRKRGEDVDEDFLCYAIHAFGGTEPPRPSSEISLRYRDEHGQPLYFTVETNQDGRFEHVEVIGESGPWEVTATIAARDCFEPASDTEEETVPGDPEDEFDPTRVARLDLFKGEAEGLLRLRNSGVESGPSCPLPFFEHSFILQGADGGKMHVPALLTRLASVKDPIGIHSGSARVFLDDGTVATGDTSGVTFQKLAGAFVPGAEAGLMGHFVGRAIDGPQTGCEVLIDYRLAIEDALGTASVKLKGLIDTTVVCACKADPARLLIPPSPASGCIFPFMATGKDRFFKRSVEQKTCDGSIPLGQDVAIAALNPISDPFFAAAAPYLDAEVAHRPMAQIFADAELSAALHRGEVKFAAQAGQILGHMQGVTGTRDRDGIPLIGVLDGVVSRGRFHDSRVVAVYSLPAAEVGKERQWQVAGAIISEKQFLAADRRPATRKSEEDIAREPPRSLSENDFKLAERIISERFAGARDLEPDERRLADADGDGKANPAEILLYLQTRQRFRAYDANKNGRLEPRELAKLRASTLNEHTFKWAFDERGFMVKNDARAVPSAARAKIDRNRDGKLSRDEVIAWSRTGAKIEFERRDLNKDGALDMSEFVGPTPRGERPVE